MIEFPEIESGQLADLFKPVHEGIAMHEELAGGFGYVQVVFEEALDRHESLAVEGIADVPLLRGSSGAPPLFSSAVRSGAGGSAVQDRSAFRAAALSFRSGSSKEDPSVPGAC